MAFSQDHSATGGTAPEGRPAFRLRSVTLYWRALDADKQIKKGVERSEESLLQEGVSSLAKILADEETYFPERVSLTNVLSVGLHELYVFTESPADLEWAIRIARDLVEKRGTGVDHANLGNMLADRFHAQGSLSDLHDSIECYRAAWRRTAPRHPERTGFQVVKEILNPLEWSADTNPVTRTRFLEHLAKRLSTRYEVLGESADLDEAIEALFEADKAARTLRWAVQSGRHYGYGFQRGRYLSDLARLLAERGGREDSVEDLDQALRVAGEADRLLPRDDVEHSFVALYRADVLRRRARLLSRRDTGKIPGAIADMNVALAIVADVRLREGDSGTILSTRARILVELARSCGLHPHLREAADLYATAAQTFPEGSPDRVDMLVRRAEALESLAEHTPEAHRPVLLDAARETWQAAVDEQTELPLTALTAAIGRANRLAAEDFGSADALAAAIAAVNALPAAAWRGLDRPSQEEQLTKGGSIARDAAACAVAANDPGKAMTLVEAGRAVLWGHMLDVRTDFSDLRQAAPDLPQRLTQVREKIDLMGQSHRRVKTNDEK